jgi:hypothetical protein
MYIPIGLSFSIHRYLSPCHVHEIMNRSFGPQCFTAIRARGSRGAFAGLETRMCREALEDFGAGRTRRAKAVHGEVEKPTCWGCLKNDSTEKPSSEHQA